MNSAQILIIDRLGLIGDPLTHKLSREFLVTLVSKWRKFPTIFDSKYSHIIVIDDDGGSLDFLPKIIDKAREINSDFIFAQELSAKSEYISDKVLNLYSSSKVVFYGDIFGNKLILREKFKSTVNKFLYQAQKFGKIQIIGDGLTRAYPVNIADVVDGLIDIVFGIHKTHSLFYIFPKPAVSELALAHMIQKANPEVGIDFIRHNSKSENFSYPVRGKYLLDDKYPLAKKIRSISFGITPKIEEDKKSEERSEKIKSFPFFIIWILIFLVLFPLAFTLFFSSLGLNTLYLAKKEIDRGGFGNAKSALHLSQTFFIAGKKSSDILYLQAKVIGRENNMKRLVADIDLGHKLSGAVLQIFNSGDYFSKVFNGQSKNPMEDFAAGQSNLKNGIIALERVGAEEKLPQPFLKDLERVDPLIKLVSNISDVMPDIFGLEGERIYLMLFQNNMELRPGGGFIGSYGILKLNMGKITDFMIHDIYDADNQLKGHVEPPYGIRRHIPSVHWYMRDSNFNVDFVRSASSSSNFLDVETGQKATGVIGVDLGFIENILSAIGSVQIADYKETVIDSNLYELVQKHSEKDFLISLYKEIQIKISDGNISYPELLEAVSKSISQKHLLFAFNNDLQNIFTVNGWSSSLWDERKDREESVNDFLGISEANLGGNIVNYFISRNLSQEVTVGDNGDISSELVISYKNASSTNSGENYKNYLRIILPKDTAVSEISINDVDQVLVDAITDPRIYEAKNFKPPIGLEIEKVNQDNKTIFGFIINAPSGKTLKVKVKYNLSRKAPLDLNAFSYNLRLFKQPGIESMPYSFALTYPNKFNVIEGKTTYSEKITKDKDLTIDFSKK